MSNSSPGRDPGKCAWCAGRDGRLEQLRLRVPGPLTLNLFWVDVAVHPRHERRVRRFLALYRRDGRKFSVSLLVLTFLLPVAAVTVSTAAGIPVETSGRWGEEHALGPYLIVTGSIVTIWPFATGLTNYLIGMRASILLVRSFGLATVGFGLWRLVGSVL